MLKFFNNYLSPPKLIRTLSASYTDPYTGKKTDSDPSSFQGEERILRENAVLRDLPNTGYAQGIRERREKMGIDVSASEMSDSAFGQSSYTAKSLSK